MGVPTIFFPEMMTSERIEKIKIVMGGAPGVGKTCLLSSFHSGMAC